jgi:hypothetical protein
MSLRSVRLLVTLFMATLGTVAFAADSFAPAGAKATLTVEYLYESSGTTQEKYDRHEWRVKRTVSLTADLAAQATTSLPALQAFEAGQNAALKNQAAQAEKLATDMAPMTANIEKLMAQCGNDDRCMEREIMKMGLGMAGTPEAAAMAKSGKEGAQVMAPGAPRYQAWRATAQKGTYVIDETVRFESTYVGEAMNYCAKVPNARCTREETRKGGAAAPTPPGGPAGLSAVEVDTVKNTLTIMLPSPLQPLAYTETVKTNYTDPYYKDDPQASSYKPNGTAQKALAFRVTANGKSFHEQPLTVALKGGWRSQSGEQVIALPGRFGEAGTLTVRWRFATH